MSNSDPGIVGCLALKTCHRVCHRIHKTRMLGCSLVLLHAGLSLWSTEKERTQKNKWNETVKQNRKPTKQNPRLVR